LGGRSTVDASTSKGSVSQHIKLYVFRNNIFRLDVEISSGFDPIFYEYWSKYSIPSVLEQIGNPDMVNVSHDIRLGNDVELVYNEAGVYLGNWGIFRDDKLVCPGIRDGITNGLFIISYDPKQREEIIKSSEIDEIYVFSFENGVFQKEIGGYLPIETVLGITPAQFYEQMIIDPTFCFEREQ